MLLAQSKNNQEVFVDLKHIENHLDKEQPSGSFIFDTKEQAHESLCSWVSEITLPLETPSSFPGDKRPQIAPFTIKAAINTKQVIGWDALININSLPDSTKVEWEIRRGYLTKIFPTVSPKPSKVVAMVFGRINRSRLRHKIRLDVNMGRIDNVYKHHYWEFTESPTEWVLLTAYPGKIAPPQSDLSFWNRHGFARGPIPELKKNKQTKSLQSVTT